MNRQLRIFWLIVFAALGATQCTFEDCLSIYTSEAIVVFRDTAGGEDEANEVTWDTVYGIGATRGISGADSTADTWLLPLNFGRDTASYVFIDYRTADTVQDTLSLTYRTVESILGIECGAEISFRRLAILNHTFDSARTIDTILTTENEANVYIYRF